MLHSHILEKKLDQNDLCCGGSIRGGGRHVNKYLCPYRCPGAGESNGENACKTAEIHVESTCLPLSILTNFEEFAVYDYRIKPNQNDRPATARILFFSFRDYAARWEEIAAVFTKEAVLRGAFDRYAGSTGWSMSSMA